MAPAAPSNDTILYNKGTASAAGFRPSQWSYAANTASEEPAAARDAARPAAMTPPPARRHFRYGRALAAVGVLALAGLGAEAFLSLPPHPAEVARTTAAAPLATIAASVAPLKAQSTTAPLAASATAASEPASDAAPLPRDLLARGDALLATGDIVAARGFYERAAELGSNAAATAVGKTYDPLFFEEAKVRGIRSDAARAAQWYRRASRAGDEEAAIRLKLLTARYGA